MGLSLSKFRLALGVLLVLGALAIPFAVSDRAQNGNLTSASQTLRYAPGTDETESLAAVDEY